MPAPRLISALTAFARSLEDARDIAEDARNWATPTASATVAQISAQRRDILTETAFLRAFIAWEVFLEETFLLYLLGHRLPKRTAPRRYGFPPSREAANEWCSDGKAYSKWSVSEVRKRADRWFKDGKPFTPALQGQQARLDQLTTIRNAVAHVSSDARTKFENLVRQELGYLPPDTTVGSFLIAIKPATTPPESFMEFYIEQMELVASSIVPK